MNKRLYDENVETQKGTPKSKRLRFVLLRVLLFLACVAVSVGIWLTVHYAEHLSEKDDGQSMFFASVTEGTSVLL